MSPASIPAVITGGSTIGGGGGTGGNGLSFEGGTGGAELLCIKKLLASCTESELICFKAIESYGGITTGIDRLPPSFVPEYAGTAPELTNSGGKLPVVDSDVNVSI